MSTEPVKRGRGRPPKPPGEKIIRRKITRPVDPEDVRWFQVECDTRGLTGPQLFRAMREAYEHRAAMDSLIRNLAKGECTCDDLPDGCQCDVCEAKAIQKAAGEP